MKSVEKFLEEHWDLKSPLLLALSGGGDSKALLYLLLQAGVPRDLLHVAHVDHSWRVESGAEALALKKEMGALGVPFHLTTITLKEKNKEADGREKRFAFFEKLFAEIPFQALLLAHHRQDLAETVLKRVFEGAHLSYLFGMEPISKRGKVPLWRPLLYTPKEELIAFLEKENIPFFTDPTNSDPHFLRARMRQSIVPKLSSLFGKNIETSLVELSIRTSQLKKYLDNKMPPIQKSHQGLIIDFSRFDDLEIEFFLSQIFREYKLPLRRGTLKRAVLAILEKNPHQKIATNLLCKRGIVYLSLNVSEIDFSRTI